MPPRPAPPACDARIGKKIDYLVAAHLAPGLAGNGFARKARTLWRAVGEGEARALQTINLQGHKWNEGGRGSFCLNFGIQFPALHAALATHPRFGWMAEWVDVPDEAAATLRTRIDTMLPASRENWWPAGLKAGRDHWFAVDERTDLDALGAALLRLVLDYGLSWLKVDSDPARFAHGQELAWTMRPGPLWQVVLLQLLGQPQAAVERFRAARAEILRHPVSEDIEPWLRARGLPI
jgi:hypothetical protein